MARTGIRRSFVKLLLLPGHEGMVSRLERGQLG